MNFLRSLLFWIWLNGSIAVVGILGAPYVLLSKTGGSAVMEIWARVATFGARWICGIKTEVRGLENLPDGPVMIASKHQSAFDTIAPTLFTRRPVYVLKQELLETPIFGWYCKRAGLIAIDRGGQMAALRKMIAEAKERFAQGRPLIIFPEGTRQEVNEAPDYKSGVAGIYTLLGVPCVPMALNTGLVWPAKGFKRYPGTAIFQFLPVIPAGLKRAEFMEVLEQRIEAATSLLLAEARQPKPKADHDLSTLTLAFGGDGHAGHGKSGSDSSSSGGFDGGGSDGGGGGGD
jgi:1-acyl-sn-glycerol-3-phosphate acyltransferase